MGTIQTQCRKCGSTHVHGHCDCMDGDYIELVQCAYCGTHTNSGSIVSGKCTQCRAAVLEDQRPWPSPSPKPPAQE